MADFYKPITTDQYEALLTELRDMQATLATFIDSRGAGASNIPANAKRWNNANGTFESWESATWVVKAISIAGGGTGATTAAAARAALGTNDAANITAGTLGADRLPTVPVTKGGTGLTTLTAGSFLQGNGTGNLALRTAAQVRTDLSLGSAALASTGDFISSAAGSVVNANIANGAVTNDKIADYGIGSTKYAAGSVGTAALADNQVTAAKLAAGVVVQRQHYQTGASSTITAAMTFNDTPPQISEGTEIMALAFTPISATNKLLITARGYFGFAPGDCSAIIALFKDSDPDALKTGAISVSVPNAKTVLPVELEHSMVAGVTSEITFSIRAGRGDTGNIQFNGKIGVGRLLAGIMSSTITIEEIKG